MFRANYVVIGITMLVLTAGVGVTGVAASPSPSGESVPGESAAQSDRLRQNATCDYTSLYNETIDSVVAVRTNSGQGSGFAYQTSENGTSYIVTNAHVVGDNGSVIVQFAQEESRRGEVVGRDRLTDLAVVRVNRTPDYVDALPISDSVPVPGREVVALGNPFGLDETITHGIVSGVNRSMPTTQGFTVPTVVQTDAPINPGNSGGPLVTCDGTVVGINTAGISASRGDNIGFAISPTLVEQVVPTLIRTGDYDHAYLGVSVAPITPGLASENDLNGSSGLYVHNVAEEGPSSGALQGSTGWTTVNGTRTPVGGDVIVGIEGRSVTSQEDLSGYLLTEGRPGETVTLTIVRDGERRRVNVTLGERPDPESQ